MENVMHIGETASLSYMWIESVIMMKTDEDEVN